MTRFLSGLWLPLFAFGGLVALGATTQAAVPYCGYAELSMFTEYVGEEHEGGYYASAVRYLAPEEQRFFEVFVKDGRLVDHRGWPIDSDTTELFGSDLWGPYGIFVMDRCGRIFLTHAHESGLFHHSTFLAGGPIASAGEMFLVDGLILYLDNASGHYRPEKEWAAQVVHRLQFLGADLSCAEIRWLF